MNIKIKENGIDIPYMADDLIVRKCHKLERMLNKFRPETISLNCDIDFTSDKKAYQVKLNLKIPQATLNATSVDKSIVNVFGMAFKKLYSSVAQLKTTLRATHETQKKRQAIEFALDSITMTQGSKRMFADFFSKNYGRLYNYALREIRFRSYQGYIKPGDIDITDLLDEALLIVAKNFDLVFEENKAFRLCFNQIKKSIDSHLQSGEVLPVSIEEPIEPEEIDSDYQEYYQPDEIIKVEDILIDADSILPEQEVEYREIETHVDKLLAQLPADWREVFILSAREGIPINDIAINKGKSVEEIEREIESASSFLRKRLTDAGFHWKE